MRTCTVCTSPKRAEIERDLVAGTESLQDLGDKHRVGKYALMRHKNSHLPPALFRASVQARIDSLENDLVTARRRVEALFLTAEHILGLTPKQLHKLGEMV